jgi:ABC-2 type transport system ATP-binding protein
VTSAWIIHTERLSKSFGQVSAVSDLTLQVARGGIAGFLGRNGAGKSTTIKMLLGMIHPTSGSGRVLDFGITDRRGSIEIRKRIAYIAEDKQAYAYFSVGEMIRFARSFYDDWQPDAERRLLTRFALPPGRKVKALSKGMRTKLALLLALARKPSLLILDEPTEGLDPVSIEELLQALVAAAADGTTVFFSSHQISEVEGIADRVCILDRGTLQIDISLDYMRDQYRHVTIGFAAPPALTLDIPGIERARTVDRQLELLVSRNVDAVVAEAHRASPLTVDVHPVGLRELFLETVQPDLQVVI